MCLTLTACTMGSSLQSFGLKLVKGCGASKIHNEFKLIPQQLTIPCFQFDCLSFLLARCLALSLSFCAQLPVKKNIVLMNAQPLNNSEQLIVRLVYFFCKYDKREIVATFFSCSLSRALLALFFLSVNVAE